MRRTPLALLAAIAAATACSPAEAPGSGLKIFNNAGEQLFLQQAGRELPIAPDGAHVLACSGERCNALTLRSPICTYGYDLTPFYANDPSLAAKLAPIQVDMDFTLYMLPQGARRAARTPPTAPEARLRPDSVDC